jgi:hypothetical protein
MSDVLEYKYYLYASCDHKPLGIVDNRLACSVSVIRIVNIHASVVVTCVCIKHLFILCPNVVTIIY